MNLYYAYHIKSTSPPWRAISALTLLAKVMASSSSVFSIGGRYHTSQTMAHDVIIIKIYVIMPYLEEFQNASPKSGSYFIATEN